ncbi:MAG: hypothetical protein JHC87_00040 [Thermoleophilaceae bacterium]|nr:hypothetical protein [Thermoleophilaceae bacterium]
MPVKLFRIVITTVIVLAVAATAALGAMVTGQANRYRMTPLEAPVISPKGPLINAQNMKAGETRESHFSAYNANEVPTVLRVTGRSSSDTGSSLYDQLDATVTTDAGDIVWRGSLASFGSGRPLMEVQPYKNANFIFTVTVPDWIGNEGQNQRSQFDLDFSFEDPNSEYDTSKPVSRIHRWYPRRQQFIKSYGRTVFRGVAVDNETGVDHVELSLVRVKMKRGHRKQCAHWIPKERKFVRRSRSSCNRIWFNANGTGQWKVSVPTKWLKAGRYVLISRAVDRAGNGESVQSKKRVNRRTFRMRQPK